MISRWDALVNLVTHNEYEGVPWAFIHRCERCGPIEFYKLETFLEHWSDPCDVSRRFALRCVRCGMIEATISRTILLGGGRA